ncbi:MAG: Flp family type IVb pilin [Novosphingobium sp.]
MIKKSFFSRLSRDATAATAVEYGLLVGLLAMTIMVGLNGFSTATVNMYTKIQTTLSNNTGA